MDVHGDNVSLAQGNAILLTDHLKMVGGALDKVRDLYVLDT